MVHRPPDQQHQRRRRDSRAAQRRAPGRYLGRADHRHIAVDRASSVASEWRRLHPVTRHHPHARNHAGWSDRLVDDRGRSAHACTVWVCQASCPNAKGSFAQQQARPAPDHVRHPQRIRCGCCSDAPPGSRATGLQPLIQRRPHPVVEPRLDTQVEEQQWQSTADHDRGRHRHHAEQHHQPHMQPRPRRTRAAAPPRPASAAPAIAAPSMQQHEQVGQNQAANTRFGRNDKVGAPPRHAARTSLPPGPKPMPASSEGNHLAQQHVGRPAGSAKATGLAASPAGRS